MVKRVGEKHVASLKICVAWACAMLCACGNVDPAPRMNEAAPEAFEEGIVPHGNTDGLAISQDLKTIVTARPGRPTSELVIFDLERRTQRIIRHPVATTWLREPAFAPDGSSVVFSAATGFDTQTSDLFVVNVHTGAVKRIAGGGALDRRHAVFAGSNSLLAYWEERKPLRWSLSNPIAAYEIVFLDLATGQKTLATDVAFAVPGEIVAASPQVLAFNAGRPLVRSANGDWVVPGPLMSFELSLFACGVASGAACPAARKFVVPGLRQDGPHVAYVDETVMVLYGAAGPDPRALAMIEIRDLRLTRTTSAPAFASQAGLQVGTALCIVGLNAQGMDLPMKIQRLCSGDAAPLDIAISSQPPELGAIVLPQ